VITLRARDLLWHGYNPDSWGRTGIKEFLISPVDGVKNHISGVLLGIVLAGRLDSISSVTRRIQRFIDDLSKGKRGPKVSVNVVAWLSVIFIAFIVGGGIYDMLDNPLTMIPGPRGGWISVHPYMGEQTLNESMVSMLLTFCMFIGLLIAYRSTKVAYDPKKANTMLVIGIAMTLLGLAGSHYLLVLKNLAARS